MRFLLSFHLAAGLVLTAAFALLSGTSDALSFAAGAGLSFLNLFALTFSWPRILAKKLVALSIGVIVFKFAILGWVIYEVVTSKRIHVGWFAGGLGLVVLSTVVTSIIVSRQSPEKADN